MNYKETNSIASDMMDLITIPDQDIYQISSKKVSQKKIDETTNEEITEIIDQDEKTYGNYENFNHFFYHFQQYINQFNSAMSYDVSKTSEHEMNERLSDSCDLLQDIMNMFKDTNTGEYINLPEFINFFDSTSFIPNFVSTIDLNSSIDHLSSQTETIKSELIEKLFEFLAEASYLSEYIAGSLYQTNYLSVFVNPSNLQFYTQKQTINGIKIMNSIFKVCPAPILQEAIDRGYIDFLLSNIENRTSLPLNTEELDNSTTTALATYFMRTLNLDISNSIELCERFLQTIQTLDIKSRGKIIFLIFNLIASINPLTNKPVMTTQDLSKLTLPNGEKLLINIFNYIGNVDEEVSEAALKIAIFFFNKEVLSPKRYYQFALQIPFSTITNKIICNDESAPFAIKLILILLSIDRREVPPKYKPDQSFYEMIYNTHIIQDIISHYNSLDFKVRNYAIDLFNYLCIYAPDDFARDFVDIGLIQALFQYLDGDDTETIKSIIHALIEYVTRSELWGFDVQNKIFNLAHDENVGDMLSEFSTTDFSNEAHELYIKLHFEDDDDD